LDTDERVSFVVPTGNFGNIFAGYCAKMMGLPINLVLATNANDILHRFISNGDYSVHEVMPTYSPSMDIQIASNFERYLYFLYKGDAAKVRNAVKELKETGRITFTDAEIIDVRSDFKSYATGNIPTKLAIGMVYKNNNYVIDPHTACGVEAAYTRGLDPELTIVLSTAHPAKFPEAVSSALGIEPEQPDAIKSLSGACIKRNVVKNDIKVVGSELESFFI
jgi:threonine synthase